MLCIFCFCVILEMNDTSVLTLCITSHIIYILNCSCSYDKCDNMSDECDQSYTEAYIHICGLWWGAASCLFRLVLHLLRYRLVFKGGHLSTICIRSVHILSQHNNTAYSPTLPIFTLVSGKSARQRGWVYTNIAPKWAFPYLLGAFPGQG